MLTSEQFKQLTKTNSWRPLVDIAGCWAVVAGALWLTHQSWWFLPLTMALIASRLHALTVIMHDGAHGLINKNEFINDAVSNVFCSFPLQVSTEVYRKTHNPHHQWTQTMKDPNFAAMQSDDAWHFPKPKAVVKRILVRDALLLTMKEHVAVVKLWQVLPNWKLTTKLERVLFPLHVLAVVAVASYFGFWKEFFIVQASALFMNPLVRLRAMSEHAHHESKGQGKVHKLEETPTINANWLERLFVAPFNTNRHLEHHTYPTIPYYNLEKAHALISQTELYKRHCKYELDGYIFGKRNSLTEILSLPEGQEELRKAA